MTTMANQPVERRIKRGWMPLRITKICDETPDTKTFFFEDAELGGRAFDYTAGQYLTFRYDDVTPKPIVRSYTMSSAPSDGDWIGVTVKRVPGGLISNWMCDQLAVGDTLRARGPIGKFVHDPSIDEKSLVFIAAGSGVTPFLSIMKEHAAKASLNQQQTRMTLIVSFRTQVDSICRDDLARLGQHPLLDVCTTFSREETDFQGRKGRINNALIGEICSQDFSKKTFFVCGPEELMRSTESFLLERGVPKSQIRLESFEST